MRSFHDHRLGFRTKLKFLNKIFVFFLTRQIFGKERMLDFGQEKTCFKRREKVIFRVRDERR